MTGRALVAIRETLLTLAAIGGVICIALVVAAQLFHVSIIMFTTGSMSPTIPAGSAALVREIPAEEIHVGDVLTVDRPGMLPVTHRVTKVSPGPDAAQRSVVMRGDANNSDDPEPYVISEGRIVLGSVPGLAHVIVWFGHPAVLAAITVSAAALVTWSFWPRAERVSRARQAKARGRHAHVGAGAGALGIILVLGAGFLPWAAASPASANEGDLNDPIRLTSEADPRTTQLFPGASGDWDLAVDSSRAPAGTLTVSLQAEWDAGLGLRLAVRSCAEPWSSAGCGRGERQLAEARVADLSGAERRVSDARTRGTLWLRITGSVPTDAAPRPGDRVLLTAVVRAGEDTVRHDFSAGGGPSPGKHPWLAGTGQPAMAWGLGLTAVLGGLSIAAVARRGRPARGETAC